MLQLIKRALTQIGVDVRKYRPEKSKPAQWKVAGLSHSDVRPDASYSPWLDDHEFQLIYKQIRDHTLVNDLRCYELWKLVQQPICGDVLEIGTWRGGTGAILTKARSLIDPSSKVFLCDTFTGVVGTTDRDPFYQDGEHSDTSEEIVRSLFRQLNLSAEILIGRFPQDTGTAIENRTFSLVHIDVDVYESGKQCFEWAWPRLAIGGVAVFDDYGFERCAGIKRCVDEIDVIAIGGVLIHNINGHAVVVKTNKH